MAELWQWLIAGTVVSIYAIRRFNTPTSNKSSTTVARYYSALSAYLMSLGFLFVLFGGGLSVPPGELITFVMYGAQSLPEDVQQLPGPLLSALLLTVVLPNVPILSKIDDWLRKSFQDMGNIPQEARRLSANMRRSSFVVPDGESLRQRVKERLAGFASKDIVLEPNNSPQFQWVKITALFVQVKSWPDTRKYDRFVESLSEDYSSIERDFERLGNKALNCCKLMRGVKTRDDKSAAKAVDECVSNFREQADLLYKALCDFIARGILRCELTKQDRQEKLREMGFTDLPQTRAPLNANQVVTMGGAVSLAILMGMISLSSQIPQMSRALFIAAMVGVMYGTAIVAAIYPKTIWTFASREKTGQRPIVAYVLSGVIAVGAAFLVSQTFKYVRFGDFLLALNDTKWSYPWLLNSFALAMVTAFLADDFVTSKAKTPTWLRGTEALAAAAIMMGTGWLIRTMLTQIPNMPEDRIPELDVVLAVSGLVGSIIGFWVPHWYRVGPNQPDSEEQRVTEFENAARA